MKAFGYISCPFRNLTLVFDILKFCLFVWILISQHRIGLGGRERR